MKNEVSLFVPTQGPCDGGGQSPRGWESKRVAEKTDGFLHFIISTRAESFRALEYFLYLLENKYCTLL